MTVDRCCCLRLKVQSGANELDVSIFERRNHTWLPDWVRDLLSGPFVCDVPREGTSDAHPVLTAVVTVTTRFVTS